MKKYYKNQMELMMTPAIGRLAKDPHAWQCLFFFDYNDVYEDDMRKYCDFDKNGMGFLVK